MAIDSLSTEARVWIYQAGKRMSAEEKAQILKKASDFVQNWSTHGNSLQAGAEILYDTFLVLAVDESGQEASGCSIDKSLRFIRHLESEFGIDFLDRNRIAVFDNGEVSIMDVDTFKKELNKGNYHKDSIIFNNLVNTISQMETKWKVPVRNSWLNKYLSDN